VTELEELKKKVDLMQTSFNQITLQLTIMHRALIRCQARCHILAEPPTGWKAVWAAIRALVKPVKENKRQGTTSTMSLALSEKLPPQSKDGSNDNG